MSSLKPWEDGSLGTCGLAELSGLSRNCSRELGQAWEGGAMDLGFPLSPCRWDLEGVCGLSPAPDSPVTWEAAVQQGTQPPQHCLNSH